MNRAVFLDRDNTLIECDGYLGDAEQVKLCAGAGEAIARLRAAGYHIIVVTNQSGVARGLITEEQVHAVHLRMQELLAAEGTGVDAVYYCPYLATDEAVVPQYRRESELRKPRPGMLFQAAREFSLDLRASWAVGDAERDVEAGRSAGCRTVRIALPAGEPTRADFTESNLLAAAQRVIAEPVEAAAPIRAAGDASPNPSIPTPMANPTNSSATTGGPMSDSLLNQILDELKAARRAGSQQDFSIARLFAAVTQAFALCALGWGLWGAIESPSGDALAASDTIIRLLIALVLQTAALTCFVAARR